MRRPKRKKQPFSRGPSLFLFIFFLVVALLTVLALEYLDWRHGRPSFIFTRLIKHREPSRAVPDIRQDLARILERNRCEYQYVRDAEGITHFKISCDASRTSALVGQIQSLVRQSGSEIKLTDSQKEKGGALFLYQVSFHKKTLHMLLLSSQENEKKASLPEKNPPGQNPRIAIIIDDIGNNETSADQIHRLGIPITAAIIPDAYFAAAQEERIQRFGLEEIIHLPMQSKNSLNHHPKDHMVTVESTPEEIAVLIRQAQKIVPHARGLNNHMGSLITSRPEWIGKVLQEIKQQGLFFIDSRTSADSVAFETARAMGIRTIYRDVFLDSVQTYTHTLAQIRQLVELARSRGEALAIGHPIDSTFKALEDSLDWIRSQNVQFVFASQLLK